MSDRLFPDPSPAMDMNDDMDSAEASGNDLEEGAACPYCGASNESCKHLVACFGVSVADIVGGVLADHRDEIVDLMMGRSSVDEAEAGEFAPDLEEFVAILRAFLEHHAEVEWAEFSVDEDAGTWDYANYWARYPGMVIDELYLHLEAAAGGY